MSIHSLVVNRSSYPSSLYIYAANLCKANEPYSTLINIGDVKQQPENPPETVSVDIPFGNHYYFSGMLTSAKRKEIGDYAREEQKDTVIHYASSFGKISIQNDIPTTVTLHDHPGNLLKSRLYHNDSESGLKVIYSSFFMNQFYKSSYKIPYIITVSQHVAVGIYEDGFKGEVLVVHPPVSDGFFPIENKESLRKELGIPLGKKVILSVSSAERRKNVSILPHIMDALGPDYILVRVGPAVSNELNFINVDRATLNKIYNASDVFLMTTLEEGFGFPLVEAFKCGIPAVTSDIEIMREVGGEAVIFSDPSDPKQFAVSIKESVENAENFRRLGIERAEKFSMPVFSKNLLGAYRTIIDNG